MEKLYKSDEKILAEQLPDEELRSAFLAIQRLKLISRMFMSPHLERHERELFREMEKRGVWVRE